MQFYNVVMGLKDPGWAYVSAGTQGKPRAWPVVGVNRNLTPGLGWVTPGKPMLSQAGNEPLLFWLWHLLPSAGLRRACHSDSEGSEQMGKMEMALPWSRGVLTLTPALSLSWALTFVSSQLPRRSREP